MNFSTQNKTLSFIGSFCLPLIGHSQARAQEAPQVDVQCGVVYSLFSIPTYGPWTSQVPAVMGGAEWNHVLQIMYAPFVVVKNNTGWTLNLDGGGTGQRPRVTFDQPELGLEFKRVGNSHAGFVTTSTVDLDQLYVTPSATPKTFGITLNGVGAPATSFKSLAPGESCVFTPSIPSTATFDTVLDWRNNLTPDLQASPGWKGVANGFCVDYLTGQAGLTSGVNGNLRIVPTRSQDAWDVRISRIGAATNSRVFRYTPPVSASWPSDPGAAAEISQFPFSLSDQGAPVSAAFMEVQLQAPVNTWAVRPIFSVILPPKTRVGFVTDRNRNGMNDEWEKFYFDGVPANPSLDQDGDGYSNYFEYLAGTSPVDPGDFIRQSLVETEDDGLRLEWSSIANRTYVVETSANLTDWNPSDPITATSNTTSQPVTRPATGPLFARIRIVPPTQSAL